MPSMLRIELNRKLLQTLLFLVARILQNPVTSVNFLSTSVPYLTFLIQKDSQDCSLLENVPIKFYFHTEAIKNQLQCITGCHHEVLGMETEAMVED